MTDRLRGGFTIEESARRLGNYRWVSMRLFEMLGRWVADLPDPEVKLRVAAASRHHGWHADLLAERLPEVRDLHPDRQTVAPNDEFAALLAAIDTPPGADATLERLVGLSRVVLPHLIAVQTWHIDRCTPVADDAVVRTLGFIVADEVADWRAAERLLQDRLIDPTSLARLSDFRLALEQLLLSSGGISGPGTTVDPRDAVGRSSSGPVGVDVGD